MRPLPTRMLLPATVCLAVLGLTRPLESQSEPGQVTDEALLRAVRIEFEAFAPKQDDPLRHNLARIEAAESIRASIVASSILAGVRASLPGPGDPRILLARLDRFARDGIHGEVDHEVGVLRRTLWSLLGETDKLRSSATFDGYATVATVLGPFGDDGDDYTGVAFPPEQGFPAAGTAVAGRFGPIRPRRVERQWDRFRIDLLDPVQQRSGCFYTLHQVDVDRDTPCYLRVFVSGSHTVFLNGEKVHQVEFAPDRHSPPYFVPGVLRKGHNQVVIKTEENRIDSLGLRYVDENGFPLENLREAGDAPLVRPYATTKPRVGPPPPWQRSGAILDAAALRHQGDQARTFRLAAGHFGESRGVLHRRIDEVRLDPPGDPELLLVLAALAGGDPILPETYRTNFARDLIGKVGDALGDHHLVFLHRIRNLENDDKHEPAARLLEERLRTGKGGPQCYRQLAQIYGKLNYWAEHRRVITAWSKAHPFDPDAIRENIGVRNNFGDYRGALDLVMAGLKQRPGLRPLLQARFDRASETGDEAAALAALDRLFPHRPDALDKRRQRATLAQRLGQEDRYLDLHEEIAADPRASLSDLRAATRALLAGGRTEQARRWTQTALRLTPSDVALRRRLWQLDGSVEFPNMAEFRVDEVEPLIAAFTPSDREREASSTLILDHQIVEVFPDGGAVYETHTLRRINDLSGVQQFEEAGQAAAADEILRLRTIGTDGRSYLPSRVEGTFSMPRLAPGAVVEEWHRSLHLSPDPSPRRLAEFTFQSRDENYLRSELVLILPPGHRSTIRTRNFPGEPEVTKLADGKTAYRYRVDNMPRLATEAFLPALKDLVPTVVLGEDGSYDAQARSYRVTQEYRSRVTPWIQRRADELVAGQATDLDKIRAIHRFLHRTIAQGSSASATQTLIESKGDRFSLELALLRAAGLRFRIGMCASRREAFREEARPFYLGEPALDLPCARVEPEGGSPLWLFAGAPRHFPAGKIPTTMSGAEVLLLSQAGARNPVGTLPTGDLLEHQSLRGEAKVGIDAAGNAEMTLELGVPGAAGYQMADFLRDQATSRRQQVARQLLSTLVPGWNLVGEVAVVGAAEGPLKLRGTFLQNGAVKVSGDERLLSLPLPASNFIAMWGGRSERTLPFALHRQNVVHWQVTLDPGPGFEIVATPAPRKTTAELIDYRLEFATRGSTVVIRRDLVQRAGTIPAARFAPWRKQLAELDAAEGEHLLLRPRK